MATTLLQRKNEELLVKISKWYSYNLANIWSPVYCEVESGHDKELAWAAVRDEARSNKWTTDMRDKCRFYRVSRTTVAIICRAGDMSA